VGKSFVLDVELFTALMTSCGITSVHSIEVIYLSPLFNDLDLAELPEAGMSAAVCPLVKLHTVR